MATGIIEHLLLACTVQPEIAYIRSTPNCTPPRFAPPTRQRLSAQSRADTGRCVAPPPHPALTATRTSRARRVGLTRATRGRNGAFCTLQHARPSSQSDRARRAHCRTCWPTPRARLLAIEPLAPSTRGGGARHSVEGPLHVPQLLFTAPIHSCS